MIELTQPSQEPPQTAKIRQMAFDRARGRLPLTTERPEKCPSVSLLVMAKNEGDTLERCVKSAYPLVDQIVIGVDSKSDDGQARWVRAACSILKGDDLEGFVNWINAPSRMGRIGQWWRKRQGFPADMTRTEREIQNMLIEWHTDLYDQIKEAASDASHFTWCAAEQSVEACQPVKADLSWFDWKWNFSEIRNNLKARCTGEWILWLDGHEYLTPTSLNAIYHFLRVVHERPEIQSLAIPVKLVDDPAHETLVQPRLIRNTPDMVWERAQHNRVKGVDYDKGANQFLPGCEIIHDRPLWVQNMRKPQRLVHGAAVMKWWKGETYFAAATAYDSGKFWRAFLLWMLHLCRCENPIERARVWVNLALGFKKKGWMRAYHECLNRAIADYPESATAWINKAQFILDKYDKDGELADDAKIKLREARSMATYAATLERPPVGVGVLESHYTWGPRYQVARIEGRLGNYGQAVQAAQEALQMGCPEEIAEELSDAMEDWRDALFKTQSDHHRPPLEGRNKRLLIVDKFNQFSFPIGQHMANKGWEVKVTAQFQSAMFNWADVIYCDWADELAAAYSTMPKLGRRLIVHCHSFEVYGNAPRQIDWNQVDECLFVAPHVETKFARKFMLEEKGVRHRTIFNGVNVLEFPIKKGPLSKDIVTLSFLNSKKGIQLLAQLILATPDHHWHVGGFWQDEILADYWDDFLYGNDLKNVTMYGEIKAEEKVDFLHKGSVFVSTSVKEGHAFAQLEAGACGLHSLIHAYPGASLMATRQGGQVWDSVEDFKRLLEKLPARHAKTWGDGKSGWDRNRFLVSQNFPQERMLGAYEESISREDPS